MLMLLHAHCLSGSPDYVCVYLTPSAHVCVMYECMSCGNVCVCVCVFCKNVCLVRMYVCLACVRMPCINVRTKYEYICRVGILYFL